MNSVSVSVYRFGADVLETSKEVLTNSPDIKGMSYVRKRANYIPIMNMKGNSTSAIVLEIF